MSVPSSRNTSSSSGRRRSHHALKQTVLKVCPTCKKAVAAHEVCAFCGQYKGREVVKIKEKKTKSA
ncbi:TPA: 50S ribosomal protein L32 [Candidatus Falkowbacteria bacterium]|nr:50S ribosomal protein L32 [Candidatus Falkowbacteria bacterium]HAY11854.1 50S ribosomal protein L32 [Candidatus Falkowbacteria bacterium]HBI96514.1 50S ribosomal protein L32 [Candidatus Falkowbacteria bacterium]HBT27467.1 50S ribosomal protein L32 [Candidatus Falkowbacteria bacterium]HBY14855.1 50S ribosomal protein L32 [Candidatus Falkowbacteria bacterium]